MTGLEVFVAVCVVGLLACLGSLVLSRDSTEDEGYTQDGSNPFRRHCNYCGQCQVRNGYWWDRVGPVYDIDCRCHTE